MKKYLNTIEDIEALKNTNTKIYSVRCSSFYHKFVNGVLCFFTCEDKLLSYNTTLEGLTEHYIEVEDEPSEEDIGKLGWFWDDDEDLKDVDILNSISTGGGGHFEGQTAGWFHHFRLLTPEEVEKYTGYKVVKEK